MKRLNEWADRHPLVRRFLDDFTFRGTVSIYSGMAVNLIYAVFRLISSWVWSSFWMGAVAVYYFVLCAMRGLLAWGLHQAGRMPTPEERMLRELKTYRLCGWSMLALQAGMTGMVVQMVRDNQHYEYPGGIIYASAFYAFYALTAAIINLVKFRRVRRPILQASRNITLAAAVMSILVLQTAMVARFGTDNAGFRLAMNTVTGAAVCLFTLGLALVMIWRGTLHIRKEKQ